MPDHELAEMEPDRQLRAAIEAFLELLPIELVEETFEGILQRVPGPGEQ